MSHAATKWAFDQPELHRDMKPSEWAVLMVLADCHNPVNGCFPSQDYICAKTNLGERAVRDQLCRLRERGLIDWDSARENGRRGSNRYILGFEPGFQPAKFAASSTGEIEQVQPADSDSFNRQNLPPNPVREPVKEPERGREREDQKSETERRREVAIWLKRHFTGWPGYAVQSESEAIRHAVALSAEERDAAVDRMADYLAAEKREKARCAYSVYLAEKRWERLPPKQPEPEKPAYAPAFGPVWGAIRMADLVTGPKAATPLKAWEVRAVEEGTIDRVRTERENRRRGGWPKVNAMDAAAETRGVGVTAPKPDEVALGALMEPVPVGSPLLAEWRAEFERQGWPWLPDPGRMPVIYFPAGGPAALGEFEAAIAAAKEGQPDAGGACEAAE
jgi:hypothetical protein